MYPTLNSLPEDTRRAICNLFQARLFEAVDLYTQMKQVHWNVRGPNFFSLHELFDKIANNFAEHVDLIAERIAQLGGSPLGSAKNVARCTTIPEISIHATRGDELVLAVATSLSTFGKIVRACIEECVKLGDPDAADILTEISRQLDKDMWLVESHRLS